MSRPLRVSALALTLLLPLIAAADQFQPLTVKNGRCEIVLPTERADDQYLLVLGSLAQTGGPWRVRVAAEPTTAPVHIPPWENPRDPTWQKQINKLAELQATSRRQRAVAMSFTPLKDPPRYKTFHLFVKDDGFANPGSYEAVTAELRGVGRHCQVYVDRDADPAKLQPTIADAIQTFDNEVWPNALGDALDVDRDGRFTLLFSGKLDRMQGGQVKLSGFVRGSDFFRDLAPPFGNRCDMMYLNTDLKPGPYLRTLLAHEYTHAVICSEHIFGDYLPGADRRDEHAWLNEAIAHLVEDRYGASWANLDYRISCYLNAPGRYSLVVPDYYGARLWRDPGTRGCTYLFLRWCVDKFGPELLTRLVQSNLSGVENLEAATQTRFAELFREWSTAIALGGSGVDVEGVKTLQGVRLRAPLASRLLTGMYFDCVSLGTGQCEITLAPTAMAQVVLHSPAAMRSRILVSGPAAADLQVTLIHLPSQMPRLELANTKLPSGEYIVSLRCHHSDLMVEHIAWERVVTHQGADDDTSFRPETASDATVRQWFGKVALKSGETVQSIPLRVPAEESVVKVVAKSPSGYRVSAWTVLK
jgi:hypothetical protein